PSHRAHSSGTGSMNTTITNNGLPKLPQAGTSPGSGSSASAATSPEAAATAARSSDQLKLTDSARALQEAARLADGSYKIDAGKIADRLLAMDQQLGGTDKA